MQLVVGLIQVTMDFLEVLVVVEQEPDFHVLTQQPEAPELLVRVTTVVVVVITLEVEEVVLVR
jgi:hypothetical protein